MFDLVNLLLRRRQRRLLHLLDIDLEIDIRKQTRRLAGYFAVLVTLHVGAMIFFEALDYKDAIWLTLTTVTTVGYGDFSAQTTLGRIATVVLLYAGGIFILAKIAGDYFDYRLQRKASMVKGQWRWRMQDHILVINNPSANIERYFVRLTQQFRASHEFTEMPIQLLTTQFPDGLPPVLRALDVLHYTGTADSLEALDVTGAAQARFIIILARDEHSIISDSQTFDLIHRLKDMRTTATIIAECVDDTNRSRFIRAGAQSVLRPIRAYPEIIVRAIAAPGSELVLENLFTHDGNHTQRYDLPMTGVSWGKIVCRLVTADLGTTIAYLDNEGVVHCNPNAAKIVQVQALFVLVQGNQEPTLAELRAELASISI